MEPLGLIIVFGIFASTLPQPLVLGILPLQFLLKNDVHVQTRQMAAFFFWCTLAWYLKPFRRHPHRCLPNFRDTAATLSAFQLGADRPELDLHRFSSAQVRGAALGCNGGQPVHGHGFDGHRWFLVEAGQRMVATGRLTALRMFVSNFCTLIQGPLGGLLATAGFMWATGVNAVFALTIFPIAYIFLKEQRVAQQGSSAVLQNAGQQLKTIIRSKYLWMALLFIALYYFSPGFSTPLFYKQTDELHFSEQAIGNLGVFSGAFAILAAILYGLLIKRVHIRILLFIAIATAAAGMLFYLFYSTWTRALLIESQNGFFGGLAELAILDLAARATPKGCEGLGTLLCSRLGTSRRLAPTSSAHTLQITTAIRPPRLSKCRHDGDRVNPAAAPSRCVDAEQGYCRLVCRCAPRRCPLHLLFLDHALANHLIHGRFHERCRCGKGWLGLASSCADDETLGMAFLELIMNHARTNPSEEAAEAGDSAANPGPRS